MLEEPPAAVMGAPEPAPMARRTVGRAAPPPAPATEPPTEEEIRLEHARQRRAFLARWGRPPLPASPSQPSVEELELFLEDFPEYRVWGVECFTYPCVASISKIGVGVEVDKDLPDRIRETFPHARVDIRWTPGPNRGEYLSVGYALAFLDSPVELRSPEGYFVDRLLDAWDRRFEFERGVAIEEARYQAEAAP